MEDLTLFQSVVFLGSAGLSALLIARALFDVFIRRNALQRWDQQD